MDNYPEHLAPEFEEGGAVKTPFEEWWARVHSHFPHVPEEVARYWLHEHWSHSPFSYLPSDPYRFRLVNWPSDRLVEVRSGWCDWQETGERCRAQGRHIIENNLKYHPYRTALYMLEHGDFPSPIIVLDNQDGHLRQGIAPVPGWEALPATYLLIEGHRRFNMGLHLQATGRLADTVRVWLMSHVSSKTPAEFNNHTHTG